MTTQQNSRRSNFQKGLFPELKGLLAPTDPPDYWPHELEADGYPIAKVGFAAEFRVPYAVLAHCLRGDRFSIVGLLNDMAFFRGTTVSGCG